MEHKYLISDAAKQVSVEPHVLRYWEDELSLEILRNELGQRYYTESDIQRFRDIRDLKEQGFQLKAIKFILPNITQVKGMTPDGIYHLREELNKKVLEEEKGGKNSKVERIRKEETKSETEEVHQTQIVDRGAKERFERFEEMLHDMVASALKEQAKESEEHIASEVSIQLKKEMEYLHRQREEAGNRQIKVLEKILLELSSGESELEVACTKEEKTGANNVAIFQERRKRRKLFANKKEK